MFERTLVSDAAYDLRADVTDVLPRVVRAL
jgi:hypothetical protein